MRCGYNTDMAENQTIRNALPGDQSLWDNLANHPLQSWDWGEFRRESKIKVERLIISTNNRDTSCWQIFFHPIPYLPYSIGYFPKGPLPDGFMTRNLFKIGRAQKAIYILLEPDYIAAQNNSDSRNKPEKTHPLPDLAGLIRAHHPMFPKYTYILDLQPSIDTLYSSLHPKTRYNIKIAQKHGVVVREDNSGASFESYLKLLQETASRQKFYAHNIGYHRRLWKHMHPHGLAHLWNAVYNGKTLASWIIFAFKDKIYYPYGASSRQHRDVMASTLLLWEIALQAKKEGFKKFDLWGSLGPEPNPKDPWYGFHRFKSGFNPVLTEFIGGHDLVINPQLYHSYLIADRIRWLLLNFRSRISG